MEQCPKCGGKLKKNGKRRLAPGKGWNQTFACTNCGGRMTSLVPEKLTPINTTLPDGMRYVITSAQNATPVHETFFAALQLFAAHNDAKLVVLPFRYRNPTSVWTDGDEGDNYWDELVEPYMFEGRASLGPNLVLLGDVKVQPTAQTPLSGFDTITAGSSGILGHPKLELRCIPTPHQKMAKIMTTTGACTMKNYTDTKTGKKGDFHHTYGACVVELKGKKFFLRQINATLDGSFIDLNWKYSHDGVSAVPECEALVMGDTHVDFIDEGVRAATFDNGGIVQSLMPKKLVWHDVMDFYCASHHHRKLVFTKIAKRKENRDVVRDEIARAVEFVRRHTPEWAQSVLVSSNHSPEHLERWIKETDWREDPTNAETYLETALHMVKTTCLTKNGTTYGDPFHFWFRKLVPQTKKFVFLKADQSYRIKDIELSMHGDRGANGARGSLLSLSRVGVKSIIGHSHTPGIREGCYQVGTSSVLRMEYNSGPSSWLHCHAVIYANGKRSLLFIVDGEWRA